MSALQKIFESGAGAYREHFGESMPLNHKKALRALENCRTDRMGTTTFACPHCGQNTHLPRSCSNRHCPSCQGDKGELWLEANSKKLLPCSYFMVTFTVPENMREPMRKNQKALYGALFKSAWESMAKLAKDKKYV